jgi:hypothetical protein
VLTAGLVWSGRRGGGIFNDSGGWDDRCSWGRVLPRASGLRVPTSRFNVELRSQVHGQGSRRGACGGELRRRTDAGHRARRGEQLKRQGLSGAVRVGARVSRGLGCLL